VRAGAFFFQGAIHFAIENQKAIVGFRIGAHMITRPRSITNPAQRYRVVT